MARERALVFREKLHAKDAPEKLLRNLKTLQKELAEIEQETIDTKRLDPYCDQLKKSDFLNHKHAAVRAAVACCLSDMLRLYAPNAPFSEAEISQIFTQFLKQFTTKGHSLVDRDTALYNDTVYVLQSLSTVKSVALLCDLPKASKLISAYFVQLMSLAEHESFATNVELYVIDVLLQLIEESASIPRAALSTLMDAFQDGTTTTQHRIAAAVCQATQDRLQKHVAQYFSEAIRTAAKNDSLVQVHEQIVRVGESIPSLLNNVIPQLEVELASNDVEVRELATSVLASLFALPGTDLLSQFSSTWRAWKGRAIDKEVSVRLKWVEGAMSIVRQHVKTAHELGTLFSQRISDPDERIRVVMAQKIDTLDLNILQNHMPRSVLEQLAERGKDRRSAVRDAAFHTLAHAYQRAQSDSRQDDPSSDRLDWIPNKILPCALAGTGEVVHSVAHVLDTVLLPVTESMESDAARLLDLYSTLDQDARAALYYFTNLRLQRPSALDAYLSGWEANQVAHPILRSVCGLLREDVFEQLQALAQWKNKKAQQYTQQAFDASVSAIEARDARQQAVDLAEKQRDSLAPTFHKLLRAGSYPILHTSLVLPLISLGQRAAPVLHWIAQDAPQLLSPHHDALLLKTQQGDILALEMLAALATHQPIHANDQLTQTLLAWCDEPSSEPADEPNTSDESINLVTICAAKLLARIQCPELVQAVHALEAKAALGTEFEQNTALQALSEVALIAPTSLSIDGIAEQIHATMLKEWSGPDADGWELNEPMALTLRLTCLVTLTSLCMGTPDVQRARPVLKLLLIVATLGQAQDLLNTPEHAKARLRFIAAQQIFRLAEVPEYKSLLLPRISQLVHVLQDEAFEVRNASLDALLIALSRGKIPEEFHAMLYIVALDPEQEIRTRVTNYTKRAISHGLRLASLFARFLHMLSHHPDLIVDDDESLWQFSQYIDFALQNIATSDTWESLAHQATLVQLATDVLPTRSIHALRAVGEIAKVLVHRTAQSHGWTASHADSQQVLIELPRDLFGSAKQTSEASWLSASLIQRLQQEPLTRRTKRTKHH
ncbi:Sister chromatid cohesion protein pds5 [Malassezia yamatoensis]|uniref:Sister chromatid cohesion protein pds5 n=1 Tax=Malassezia yamatoensis TaxID=253288 RepID=A0AAJ5YVG6_9BASI|nr:Sister chromatid cohesion protein pds5 [Malassezia yamatoensis]